MRIAMLTGGGDVPGLNPAIKVLVNRAIDAGHEPIGLRRGWRGLLFYNPDDPTTHDACVMSLDKAKVRTVDRFGGTFLHTSRTKPSNTKLEDAPKFLLPEGEYDPNEVRDFTDHLLRVLEHLKVDVLIPIGGEDTLGYGARIHDEGFPVVSIPKTMDNDVFGTDYCLGFSTAITRSVTYINQMRSSVGSHERIGVVELFGRYSGATALFSAYLSDADRAILAEVPFDVHKLADLLMQDKQENDSCYAIMTISEGAREIGGDLVETGKADAFGHRKLGGIGKITAEKLKEITGHRTMFQQIGYLMRSGAPTPLDVMCAFNYANLAMDLIDRGETGRMVALQKGCYTHVSAAVPKQGARPIDIDALYDADTYRPRVQNVLDKPMFLY